MKFKFSFKLHSDKIINGSRYILDFPGLINIKTEDECLACKLLCKDNTIFKYLPKDVIIEGWNNIEIIGDGEGIYLIINEHHFTLLKPLEITDTIASAFTTSNYWTLPGNFRSTNNATYTVKFNSGSLPQSGKNSNMVHAQNLFALYINTNSTLDIYSWNNADVIYTFNITTNTDYTATVYLNGYNRTYTLVNDSTGDSQTYSFIDYSGEVHPYANDYIVIGNHTAVTESWAGSFLGSIYLKEFTINIDGTEVFNGQMILDDKFNIYSNFSYYNYLTIPSTSLNLNNNDDVTYIIKFKSPDSTYSMQQLFDFGDSYQLYFSSSSFNVNFWNNHTQEDISVFTASANTIYWVKFRRYQGTTYVSYSTDGTSYSEPVTSYDPYVQSSTPSYGWLGRFRTSGSDSRYYRGTIYMSDFKQIINGNTTIDGATATEGKQYSVTGSLIAINNIGVQKFGQGPSLSDIYSGESYPTIETGTLKLYQSWLSLKDIEAIGYEDSDESDEPIIENLIYRRGSTDSNIQLIPTFSPNTATSWELRTQFMSTTSLSTWTDVVKFSKGSSRIGVLEYDVNHGQIQPFLSSNGSSWDIVQTDTIMSTFYPQANTWYDIKLGFTGSYYYLETKLTTDDNFTRNLTCNTTTKMYGSDVDIFLINATTAQTRINLAKTLLTADNTIIFDGSHSQENVNYINHGCTVVTE